MFEMAASTKQGLHDRPFVWNAGFPLRVRQAREQERHRCLSAGIVASQPATNRTRDTDASRVLVPRDPSAV
jgi:hypothetical protein